MRKGKITSLILAVLCCMVGNNVWAQDDTHVFENGICTNAGCDRHFEEPPLVDDYYELSNAGHVEWFSKFVADGQLQINGKLMNDIDFQNIENLHEPIGPNTGRKYNGIFDGQGFRIKNMIINRPESENQGFFGFLRGNAQDTWVKNLIIDKSCSITGLNRVAGIAANGQNNETIIYIINCVNEGTISTSTGTDAAGILGSSTSNHPKWHIENCINTGTITGTGYAGALTGWMGDNSNVVIKNFINIGEVVGYNHPNNICRTNNATVTGIYDLSPTVDAVQGVIEGLTPEDITNGKLCYIANGDQTEIVWRQTLEVDAYPTPFETSKQVYAQGSLRCDGTPNDDVSYTNTPFTPTIPDHTFTDDDWHCSVCGNINTEFIPQVDGVYQIGTVLHLLCFAELVTSGQNAINAVLTSDIDLAEVAFPGIGSRNMGYKGTFDGQYHVIKNLNMAGITTDWSGFFNFVNGGATIKNLTLDENCYISGGMGVGMIGGSAVEGQVLLQNLGMRGTVEAVGKNAGGIHGGNTGSKASLVMENCYVTGSVTGSNECGSLSGWMGSNNPVARNCWTSGEVTGADGDGTYATRHENGKFTNCYSMNGTQFPTFTWDEVECGALTYKLNGDQTTMTWFQNLDNDREVDVHPTFDPSHGAVYVVAAMKCDGTFDADEAGYSNNNEVIIPDHTFKEGFCSVCGHEDGEYPFLKVFANADHDVNTGYENFDSGDGSGLAINNSVAEHWNQKYFTTYQPITGLQKGVYKLRVQGLSRVEKWDNAEGKAYHEGVLSEEYAPLYHNSQYYVEIGGQRVANLFVDIATGRLEKGFGETENFNEVTNAYVPNSLAACNKWFSKGHYWNAPIYFAVESEEDTVLVGVENKLYLDGNWTVWDTWRLEYVSENTEDAIKLIGEQQTENIQDLSSLSAQASLVEAYEKAQEQINEAGTLQEMMSAADVLSRTPQEIRLSHLAYQKYDLAVKAVMEEMGKLGELFGPHAELLDKYLTADEEPSEELPNGTYPYIISMREISMEALEAEILFAQELLTNAVKNSISEGSDISNLILNPTFSEDGKFKNWTYEITVPGTNYNFSSNTGFKDIYPVAGTYNTAFNLWQDMEGGLPNGIYELEAPAYHRPGGEGMGDMTGEDFVTADLYINDYYTPIMNLFKGAISYDYAKNGVNCRYDAVNDPEAPHNGEETGSQDIEVPGVGYVPNQRHATSFAFAGGRYVNHAYAIVTDGQIRLGIRNQEKPWYEGGMVAWGAFRLVYHGKSMEAMNTMMENFNSKLTALKNARDVQDYNFSSSYITTIESLMAEANATTDVDAKMEAIQKINAAFNNIPESYSIFLQLRDIADNYLYTKANEYMSNGDETTGAKYYNKGDEILNHVYAGDLTDEEALALLESVLNDTEFGGGFYVQGDLLDAEGNKLTYGTSLTNYPMTAQGDGTYVATVKVQNRANQANSDARAGIYFTRMHQTFRATDANRRFVTPADNKFEVISSGGSDLQTVGGEFRIVLNPKAGTVEFEAIDYKWHDKVYVVGSIIDQNGAQHRYKNDEVAPLPHKGNGVYEGSVTFYQDEKNPGWARFTIFACRSSLADIEYLTTTRSDWNEARYGSDTNELPLEEGATLTDIIRGQDRNWRITWDTEETTLKYIITFDMNNRTLVIKKDDGTGIEDVISNGEQTTVKGIYNLNGQRVKKATRGIYIIDGKKVLVK